MKFLKGFILFYIGGSAYMALEFLWRGRSHGSMFLLGGLCFLLVGGRISRLNRISLPLRAVLGSCVITTLELGAGFVFNRNYQVWDYRNQVGQVAGQICLPYFLLWIPVSLIAMKLYAVASRKLDHAIMI